jgi:hypothetical protein
MGKGWHGSNVAAPARPRRQPRWAQPKGKTWQLREREQFGRRLTQSVRVDPRPFQSSNGLEIRHVEW